MDETGRFVEFAAENSSISLKRLPLLGGADSVYVFFALIYILFSGHGYPLQFLV